MCFATHIDILFAIVHPSLESLQNEMQGFIPQTWSHLKGIVVVSDVNYNHMQHSDVHNESGIEWLAVPLMTTVKLAAWTTATKAERKRALVDTIFVRVSSRHTDLNKKAFYTPRSCIMRPARTCVESSGTMGRYDGSCFAFASMLNTQ